MLGLLNLKLIGIGIVAAVLAVAGAYKLGHYKGYKEGHELGFRTSEDAWKIKELEWKNQHLEYQVDRFKKVDDTYKAVEESIQRSAQAASKLDKRIGELRDKAKFNSNPTCRLSDDELQNLRSAYGVRAGVGADEVSNRESPQAGGSH